MSDSAGMDRQRRALGLCVGLIALGGAVMLFSSSRVWLRLTAVRPAPFGALTAQVSGKQEFGAVAGIAVVMLLGAVLALVSGKWPRLVLAMLLAVLAVVAGWTAARGFMTPSRGRLVELLGGPSQVGGGAISATNHGVWAALAVSGAALCVVGAVYLAVGAPRWRNGLSRRFEAPVASGSGPADAPTPTEDPWRRLDRGDDPTISDR
ncbi:Trp biosynthesis-associated membrane protein [Jatrophihabitans telluris]|uniref:Trp biosynthesis-associated membrane protein n=1 Tax=Jatrophihabitans telluris TaxID=2038343 RepID=A0ABY4QUQ3_9ACTN|nr:Trp biosynthesis-associated membrane protein [Jatrophihabitans telluris]UQX87158.1 Trp biosynthesis-associated membrane protein [Jatrophihabitans telluris]